MKKVLFVFNHPAPYKVRLLNELATFLDLTVIFERGKNSDREKNFYFETKYNFKTHYVKGIKVGKEGFISFGVRNYIKKNKFDLVIMNGYSHMAEMISIKYLQKHKIPYCLYINGGIINKSESNFKRNYKTKLITGADFYMSPDKNSNNYLVYYGADKSKIYNYPYSTVYENEILTHIPTQLEINELRKAKNIDSKYVYVSCGQLIPRKNYMSLIKYWPEDKDKLLLIIGEGKQRQEIEQYLMQNPNKNVKLLGFLSRKDIFEYYKLSDAFLFPSKEDIYGHVINEALSQGLPIISSSKVNASLKLINEGRNGYIIDDYSTPRFQEILEKVPSLNKQASIDKAKENTIELMKEAHRKILQ